MPSALFVYITTSSAEEAKQIGRALVEERLAACANILNSMQSVYRWQGKIEEATEAILIAKTRASLFERLAARVKDLHSAECPCIVAWPLAAGTPDFLQWIEDNTHDR